MSPEEPALGAWYRLVEEIGSGAAGVVWRAVDTRTDEPVAAKLLRPEHARDPKLVERFVRERSLLMSLRDDAVVPVRDMVVEGERLAIITDYMPSGSLGSQLEAGGPLGPATAALVTAAILDGIDAAHAAGIVHRDLKPDNVLLEPGWQAARPGTIRVTDFGISKLLTDSRRSTTGLIGTPEYMPPELITAGEAGFAADVYAAGILLYELLAGRTPFAGPGTDYTVAHRHVVDAPPRLPVGDAMWELIASMLAKAPGSRPTAAEAAASLRRMASELDDRPIDASATGPSQPADHPATILRGAGATPQVEGTGDKATAAGDSKSAGEDGSDGEGRSDEVAPDLGEPSGRTVLRPITVRRQQAEPEAEKAAAEPRPLWRRPAVLGSVAGAVVILIVAGWFAVRGFGHDTGETAQAAGSSTAQQVRADQQDEQLPTGLGVTRQAGYDPQAQQVSLTITYSAQKAALTGPMLEVVPGLKPSGGCPVSTWEGAAVSENLPSTTGITAACGWSVQTKIAAQQKVSVTAKVHLRLTGQNTQQALQSWLDAEAAATAKALGDTQVRSTSYPVQRLQSIQMDAPQKAVSRTTLPITLEPVWPSGPDAVNPMYKSPSSGAPSSLLTAVAGGEAGVRFSDGCAGALTVSPDGLTVTTVSISPQCTVRASVGNFTDLSSSSFAIVARGG